MLIVHFHQDLKISFSFLLCASLLAHYTGASPNHVVLSHDDLIILSLSYVQVKLTIMIEDPRDVERKRLLGIEDLDAPTRDDLVAALEEVSFFFCSRDYLNCALICRSIDTLTHT